MHWKCVKCGKVILCCPERECEQNTAHSHFNTCHPHSW